MQKVLRRTAQAQRHASKQYDRKKALETGRDRIMYRKQKTRHNRDYYDSVREARKNQREDYSLGPLAPWRDNPLEKDTYGACSIRRIQPPKLAVADRKKLDDWFIRDGDRVVVVNGREGVRGRIGVVTDRDEESQTLTVEGVNLIEITMPDYITDAESATRRMTREQQIPLDDVQLVVALPDSRTGHLKDHIINPTGLSREDVYWNHITAKLEWSRYVQPQNMHLPWPRKDPPQHRTQVVDTPLESVETITHRPDLVETPFPSSSIMDELRGKFSKFRKRHDEKYLQKKMAEDEYEERWKRREKMMLEWSRIRSEKTRPFWDQRKGQKLMQEEEKGRRLEILEQIGAYMETKQAPTRNTTAANS